MSTKKKVFVSGCFDMLHSGHVRFLEEAATYGELHIGLGSDQNIVELKKRAPVNTQDERKYILESIRHVSSCRINTGRGMLDFITELEQIQPDVFIVNEDGDTAAKRDLCSVKKIEYIVLKRIPYVNLPARSTTNLRKEHGR